MSAGKSSRFVLNVVLVLIALNPRDYPVVIGVVAPMLTMMAASIFTTRYSKAVRSQAPRCALLLGAAQAANQNARPFPGNTEAKSQSSRHNSYILLHIDVVCDAWRGFFRFSRFDLPRKAS
jgi:hypothetical protein